MVAKSNEDKATQSSLSVITSCFNGGHWNDTNEEQESAEKQKKVVGSNVATEHGGKTENESDLQSSTTTDIEDQSEEALVKTDKDKGSVTDATSDEKGRSKEPNLSSLSLFTSYFIRPSSVTGNVEKQQTDEEATDDDLGDGNSDDRENIEGGLSEDTFSFMKVKPMFSRTWLFAMVVYLMQLLLVMMILSQQISSSQEGTPFNIPFKVDTATRVAQIMAIIFIVFMSKDVVMPTREISFLWVTNDEQWSKVVGLLPNNKNAMTSVSRPSWLVWVARIFFPNILQFVQGGLVLIISFIIVIQTDDVVELFANFAAMYIISDLDNIAFELAKNGYFGCELTKDAHFIQHLKLEDQTLFICYAIPLRPLMLFGVFLITLCSFIPVALNQMNGKYFRSKFPNCAIDSVDIVKIGDGSCDGGLFNSFECGFDGGDCALFNVAFPSCKVQNPKEIGDGICQEQYKTDECGFDSLDCCEGDKSVISNGVCDPLYNTALCSWDGGDCRVSGFDFCHVNSTEKIGNGECDGIPYNTAACGWDGSDCLEHNRNFILTYPNCIVFDSTFVANGRCDGGDYMVESCNYDGGDCIEYMEKYPMCNATDPWRVGDGHCDSDSDFGGEDDNFMYLTYECGWDGGDCIDEKFPNCNVNETYKALLGNGICEVRDMYDKLYNDEEEVNYYSEYSNLMEQVINFECGYDGGDCINYYGPVEGPSNYYFERSDGDGL